MSFSFVTHESQLSALERLKGATLLAFGGKIQGEDPNRPWRSQLRLLQIASHTHGFLIDLSTCDPFPALLPFLQDENLTKVMPFAKPLVKQLLHRLGLAPVNLFCLELAARLSGMGNRVERETTQAELEGIAARYGWSTQEANQEPLPSTLSESRIEALSREPEIWLAQHAWLAERINHYKLKRVAQLEFRTITPVAAMELRGIGVDPARLDALAYSYQQRLANLEKSIAHHFQCERNLFGEMELNLNSPDQLRDALIRKGIPVADTAEHTLRPLIESHPFIRELLEHRHVGKLLNFVNSQLRGAIDPVTRRIHAHYHQIASASGRFACSDPNMQQVPREDEIRACILPAPGYSFIVADYSQVELRVAAGLSGDPLMREAYQRGEDLHRLTAALTMGKPVEAVLKSERQAAKAINFGLIYAMGANGLRNSAKLSYGVEMSQDEAALFRRRYFENYRGIADWQREMERLGKGQGYIRTGAGRIRSYKGEAMRVTELLNTPVQGTAAEGLKSALCIFHDRVQELSLEAGIVAIIHDEIIVEVKIEQSEKTLNELKKAMVRGIAWLVPGIPFEVDALITDAWSKA